MKYKEFICIRCPRGCHLKVDENLNVTGNMCPRGAEHGKQEASNPQRIVTSTVRIEGSFLPMCPVKTSHTIPKGKMFEIMSSINATKIQAPVHIGDVVIKDVCGTGVDIIACRNMEKI